MVRVRVKRYGGERCTARKTRVRGVVGISAPSFLDLWLTGDWWHQYPASFNIVIMNTQRPAPWPHWSHRSNRQCNISPQEWWSQHALTSSWLCKGLQLPFTFPFCSHMDANLVFHLFTLHRKRGRCRSRGFLLTAAMTVTAIRHRRSVCQRTVH